MKNIKMPINAVLLVLSSFAVQSSALEIDSNAWKSLDAPPRDEPEAIGYGRDNYETTRLAANTASSQPTQNMYFELLSQIEILQREVQELRGTVEEQGYVINKLRREQKERYVDLDRRVSTLIKGESGASWDASAGTDSDGGGAEFSSEGSVDNAEAANNSAPPNSVDSGHNGPSEAKGERESYIEAFGYIRDKDYDTAITALDGFIGQYPSGKYTGNAYYWLGEIYSTVRLDLGKARDAFTLFLERYPNHRKVPDAMYKLGVVYAKQGEKAIARDYFERVINDMSDTPAAASAQEYLNKL